MLVRAAHAAVLATVMASGLAPVAAVAQEVVSVRATMGGPGDFGGASRLNRRGVDKYAEVLGLSEDQKAMAVSLLEGYEAAATEAQTQFRAQMEELSKSFRDNEDHTVWSEKMPKIQKENRDRMRALEKGYFDDLRAVLTNEQGERWAGVERVRRREVVLRTGASAGENVDLLAIIEGLKLAREAMEPLAEPLSQYELELDRALAAKQREQDQSSGFQPGQAMDPEAMKARMARFRELGQQIKEVNQRNARRIEGLIPEEKREAFLKAVREATFPRVYRQAAVTRRIDSAMGLADLDAGQKEAIQQLRESYQRESGPVNDRWASAIEESERSGESGTMLIPGGTMQVSFGGNESGPLADARKARREVDDRAREKLDSILSKEQRERLPKESAAPEGQFHMIGAEAAPIMIRTIDERR